MIPAAGNDSGLSFYFSRGGLPGRGIREPSDAWPVLVCERNIHITTEQASTDAIAITAVLAGDRERFRELVERYEDKVFAIAWSRLGDRSLAEEAAQEAFINAYRRLSLLGGAGKFGQWVTTIARNTAINLGIRNRSELNKRERWSIERMDNDAGEVGNKPNRI